MAKTAIINVRTEPDVKADAEKLFSAFGITVSDAVNIFLRKSIMEGGLPFEMKQPHFNRSIQSMFKQSIKKIEKFLVSCLVL